MKFAVARPHVDPEAAARKLVESASRIEPMQDAPTYIELVNLTCLRNGGNGDEFRAGIKYAGERGWLELHESGTSVRMTTEPRQCGKLSAFQGLHPMAPGLPVVRFSGLSAERK
jgi:hypothetical protein